MNEQDEECNVNLCEILSSYEDESDEESDEEHDDESELAQCHAVGSDK